MWWVTGIVLLASFGIPFVVWRFNRTVAIEQGCRHAFFDSNGNRLASVKIQNKTFLVEDELLRYWNNHEWPVSVDSAFVRNGACGKCGEPRLDLDDMEEERASTERTRLAQQAKAKLAIELAKQGKRLPESTGSVSLVEANGALSEIQN